LSTSLPSLTCLCHLKTLLLLIVDSPGTVFNISNISLGDFCSLTQNFTLLPHHMLHIHVWTKLTTHSNLTRYCSVVTECSLSKHPRDLCLIASPNITSNSIARSSGTKLKISLETFLPVLVCCSLRY
jgi:hypothetical protein